MVVMINFLEEKYGAKATCSHVSQDRYEVGNLITQDSGKSHFSRQNGFLVEHFIKPPVDVNFSFPSPIHISCIELGLSVGAQTTDGVEILVTDEPDDRGVFRVVFRQCPITVNHLRVSNASFKTRPPFQFSGKDSEAPSRLFKFSHLLKNVKIVRVRIIKTVGSSVPALGSVKIFGVPGTNCKPEEFEKILNSYRHKRSEFTTDDDIQILSSGNAERKNSFKVNIPEEFLDPLTCEVMALPMLLPSGHSVDQSTLEKFSSSQASWGRLPCDPFTGIPFGPDRKPISNAPLKTRIDAFLIKNASLDPQLSCVPRSLGKKPGEFSREKRTIPTSSNVTASPVTSIDSYNESVELPVTSPPVLDYNTGLESSHEKALQNSLDMAMKQFYRIPGLSRQDFSNEKGVCVACKDSSSPSRYKLPCEHCLCRNCLLSLQNSCPRCQKPFLREQVHRTYNIP